MTGVTLRVDGDRWRTHLQAVGRDTPGLVPVIKGNGYGYGRGLLAAEARTLGAGAVAVGNPSEVADVRAAFPGDVVVMNPYEPADALARELLADPRVVTTVGRPQDLAAVAASGARPRVIVEVLTSMRRYGLAPEELGVVAAAKVRVRFEGWTLHLPLAEAGRAAEAGRLARTAVDAVRAPLWTSHLPAAEAAALGAQLGVSVRCRVGTRLWLGAEGARATTATVLDVHRVRRGERAGYRQRTVPADGHVVVVAGGTAHGVGLEAPTPARTLRQRAVALAGGTLEAAGLALSPYTIAGRKRWFLEPPHMQVSQLFLPAKVPAPAVGDEVPVELRLTTATVDQVVVT